MPNAFPFVHGNTYRITIKDIGAITADKGANVTVVGDPTKFSEWYASIDEKYRLGLFNVGLQPTGKTAFLEPGATYIDAKVKAKSDDTIIEFDGDPFSGYVFKITKEQKQVQAVWDEEDRKWKLEVLEFSSTRFHIQNLGQYE